MKPPTLPLLALAPLTALSIVACADAAPATPEKQEVKPIAHFDPATFTKPSEEELRASLSPLEFHVTQEEGTERAFANIFNDNHEAGIYVDIVSGEPLFSSLDKFDSGTGWPSFTRPLVADNVVERVDNSFGMVRVEVRSKHADSHLGHLFDDGPLPTGLRYCMNSAAMAFVPVAELEERGYGAYAALFDGSPAGR